MIDRAPPRAVAPLVLTWLGTAVVLGLLLALARASLSPLDDPDPAWQRPGFLDAGDLPAPAPTVAPGVPAPARPTVVFFAPPGHAAELCRALAERSWPEAVTTVVVVAGSPTVDCDAAGYVVGDPAGAVADAYGMRRPLGGGRPVGYAVVDAAGAIRYRTLDPDAADRLGEVGTMVASLP